LKSTPPFAYMDPRPSACSADNERLVSASEDATARVWDVASRQTTHVLRHPKNVPMSCAVLARRERVAGDGAGGGGGGGGGGEKRKLAPLAPFSRFASGGGGGGAGGKLKPWEGAPIALRGVGGDVGGVGVGASSGVVVSWGGGGGGDGEKKKRGRDDAAAEEENEDGDEDAGPDLRRRLADAEKVASAAREETKAWKAKHAELRAFVADELVNRETSK